MLLLQLAVQNNDFSLSYHVRVKTSRIEMGSIKDHLSVAEEMVEGAHTRLSRLLSSFLPVHMLQHLFLRV